ncbi:MAG: aspartate aminotransferase family protein [Deltaproteobacteria bacterium]|nr:aspartate aminotransferase family protein [Deltaproteobacteria bacterium]MBW2041116.1 aspartate aminotransferase family protein [Deltaproteobacteria bacterium]MBW2132264.1 aspartate aminotransferase family protein [Deltaproteobacteria bacterium]
MSQPRQNHLFYQARSPLPIVERAEGIRIWDSEGRSYIDGCSGAVISNIGYGNPRIPEVIAEQSKKAFFVYRTQFENQPAIDLAAALVAHSAPHLNRVYFVSGGSEAVESAMKLCRQYFFNKGEGSRIHFISREPSYHGSTLGALALTSYAPLEIPFRPMIRVYPKIPAPYCYRCRYGLRYPSCGLRCAWALEETLRLHGPENVAAFVAEPVGGASTGAVVPPDDYFEVIQGICRKYGILLILDEVMTGFGRTGKLFAYEHWGIEADIVALSKGMAAGYYPLGAVMTRSDIVEELLDKGGFSHGHTYAGNPMACAVGLEVLRIITGERLPENAAAMGGVLKEGLDVLSRKYEVIGDVRGKGLLLAVELVRDRTRREAFPPERNVHLALTEAAFAEGLIIYPRRCIGGLYGDHVLVAPPLIVGRDDCREILDRLDRAFIRLCRNIEKA